MKDKELKDKILNNFNKYYDYIRTTDDGEQRGEWKTTFVEEIINIIHTYSESKNKELMKQVEVLSAANNEAFKIYELVLSQLSEAKKALEESKGLLTKSLDNKPPFSPHKEWIDFRMNVRRFLQQLNTKK